MPQSEKKESLLAFVFETAEFLTKIFAVMLIIITFFFRQVTVNGNSMNDTLQNNDRLLVWSFCYEPKPNDIVTITHGAKLDDMLIKRVIAVGGQRLDIDYSKNEVSVDGVLLHEDYIKGRTIKPQSPISACRYCACTEYHGKGFFPPFPLHTTTSMKGKSLCQKK